MEMISLKINKIRETEKAIQAEIPYITPTGATKTFKTWLPKSQIEAGVDFTKVACWILGKKCEEFRNFIGFNFRMMIIDEADGSFMMA